MMKLLGLTALLVLPLAAGCGDDDDSDNPTGGSQSGGKGGSGGGSAGKGGSSNSGGSSGKGGTSNEGGSGNEGNTGNTGNEGGSAGGGGDPVECDLDALEDGGNVPTSGTLESGKFYNLDGRTEIEETLTIEPCVKVLGDAQDDVLVVVPGGQLVADGEADAPIVFTSGNAEPAPGDWGGIILLGNGVCNDATDDEGCIVEGLVEPEIEFGNTEANADNEESSGSLQYVRIEYSGVDLDGGGNEINGLTLAGVGSGTTISHVMVANTLDDCFEWFGGAVNADHLIAYNCGDDMFDADSGFSGHVQFAFGRQVSPVTSDPNGFEWDNDSTTPTKEPVSAPKFSNVTVCGTGEEAAGDPNVGGVLRRGVGGSITNAIITGFETAALSVRDTPDTAVTVTYTLQFDNTAEFDGTHAGGATWFTDQDGNGSEAPEDFGDCWADPPAPFPAEKIEGVAPTGQADEDADFIGAFEDADDNWISGAWVSWE
jgi:hypothetical protein